MMNSGNLSGPQQIRMSPADQSSSSGSEESSSDDTSLASGQEAAIETGNSFDSVESSQVAIKRSNRNHLTTVVEVRDTEAADKEPQSSEPLSICSREEKKESLS